VTHGAGLAVDGSELVIARSRRGVSVVMVAKRPPRVTARIASGAPPGAPSATDRAAGRLIDLD
jgi:hypothetical protein